MSADPRHTSSGGFDTEASQRLDSSLRSIQTSQVHQRDGWDDVQFHIRQRTDYAGRPHPWAKTVGVCWHRPFRVSQSWLGIPLPVWFLGGRQEGLAHVERLRYQLLIIWAPQMDMESYIKGLRATYLAKGCTNTTGLMSAERYE